MWSVVVRFCHMGSEIQPEVAYCIFISNYYFLFNKRPFFNFSLRKYFSASVWAQISIFVVFAGVNIRIHAFRFKKTFIKYCRALKLLIFLEKKEYFVLCTRVYRSNWKLPFLEKIRFKTQGLMIKFLVFI